MDNPSANSYSYIYDVNSGSDWLDFDSSPYEYSEITKSIKQMVETYSEDCILLDVIYGTTASGISKEIIRTAKECSGLQFFSKINPGEDLIWTLTCAIVCYWSCCETIQKIAPVTVEATVNLLNY